MKTKTRIVASAKKLAKAEETLKESKRAHRAAFRAAVAKVFTEYRFALEADGDLSAHLKIVEFGESQKEYSIKDLPE